MIAFPIAGIISYFNWVNPSFNDLIILITIGIITQIAQYFMTKSFQSEKVSTVSIVSYTEIILVIAIGYQFFDETFNFLTYFGMFIVVISVITSIIFSSKHTDQIDK